MTQPISLHILKILFKVDKSTKRFLFLLNSTIFLKTYKVILLSRVKYPFLKPIWLSLVRLKVSEYNYGKVCHNNEGPSLIKIYGSSSNVNDVSVSVQNVKEHRDKFMQQNKSFNGRLKIRDNTNYSCLLCISYICLRLAIDLSFTHSKSVNFLSVCRVNHDADIATPGAGFTEKQDAVSRGSGSRVKSTGIFRPIFCDAYGDIMESLTCNEGKIKFISIILSKECKKQQFW